MSAASATVNWAQVPSARFIKGRTIWHVHTGSYRTMCGTSATVNCSDEWPTRDLCPKCAVRLEAKLVAARALIDRYGDTT